MSQLGDSRVLPNETEYLTLFTSDATLRAQAQAIYLKTVRLLSPKPLRLQPAYASVWALQSVYPSLPATLIFAQASITVIVNTSPNGRTTAGNVFAALATCVRALLPTIASGSVASRVWAEDTLRVCAELAVLYRTPNASAGIYELHLSGSAQTALTTIQTFDPVTADSPSFDPDVTAQALVAGLLWVAGGQRTGVSV